MQKVINVRAIDPYVLEVTFADGELRRVNVEHLLFGEMFEPLRDPAIFRAVTVNPELGTIVWPNGTDLSPEFLYAAGVAPVSRSGCK